MWQAQWPKQALYKPETTCSLEMHIGFDYMTITHFSNGLKWKGSLFPYLRYIGEPNIGYFLRYHDGVPSPQKRIQDIILCLEVGLKNWFFRALFGPWIWLCSPIAILVQNSSKVSFLLIEWGEKEKKWTSINIWRNICNSNFAIFTTII